MNAWNMCPNSLDILPVIGHRLKDDMPKGVPWYKHDCDWKVKVFFLSSSFSFGYFGLSTWPEGSNYGQNMFSSCSHVISSLFEMTIANDPKQQVTILYHTTTTYMQCIAILMDLFMIDHDKNRGSIRVGNVTFLCCYVNFGYHKKNTKSLVRWNQWRSDIR